MTTVAGLALTVGFVVACSADDDTRSEAILAESETVSLFAGEIDPVDDLGRAGTGRAAEGPGVVVVPPADEGPGASVPRDRAGIDGPDHQVGSEPGEDPPSSTLVIGAAGETTSTIPPGSTTTTTTTAATAGTAAAARPAAAAEPVGHFATVPAGSALPSGDWCAARIRPTPETRAMNARANATRGTHPNERFPRVDGDFVGTTDEIIQWAACKWGIDENIVRSQVSVESWWDQANGGDFTTDQSLCGPRVQTGSGECPQSVGLMQIKYRFHTEAFTNGNAVRSSAYNLDYAYAIIRSCFEGEVEWLNDVERGWDYRAGDLEGCLGVWYAGRWYANGARDYIREVKDRMAAEVWTDPDFLKYRGKGLN